MSLVSIIKVLLFSRFFVAIRRLKVKKGSKCYIIANGPSLKNSLENDFDFLCSQELFVMNEFAQSEYYEKLQPKYYVLADPCYWDMTMHDYNDFGVEGLGTISDKTCWPVYLIVPNAAYKSLSNYFKEHKYIKVINYNTTDVNGYQGISHFFYKNYLGMPVLQNVLVGCIYFSINMQFSEINILGADHSWTKNLVVNDQNEVCLADDHFYDKEEVSYKLFRQSNGNLYKMHQILRDYAQMFESYHLLKAYADRMDVRIYNRGIISFIDAFDRKSSG